MPSKTRMSFMNMKMRIKHSNKIKFLSTKYNPKIFMKSAVTEILAKSKNTSPRRILSLKITKRWINPGNILKTHAMTIQTRKKLCFTSEETKTFSFATPSTNSLTRWTPTLNLLLPIITIRTLIKLK
jgi:hypothetical protein